VARLVDAFDAATPVLALSELTERTGLPKSTVHRMAEQLVDLHWLDRTPLGYRLGMRFLELGGLVAGRNHLRDRAMPYLQDLQMATGHPVHLAVLEAGEVVVVEKVWGHNAPPLPTRIGSHLPAHATALGKALLAFAGDDEIERAIAKGLEQRTGRTVVVPAVLRHQLRTARTTNWTLEDEENVVGVRCVAAPIRGSGRAIAAVSASGTVHTLDISRVVPLVRRCAADIWSQLFGRRAPAADGSAPPCDNGPWDIEQWRAWLDQVAGEWL
jgi:DNA-binding IclR family transcriptional regulator